MVLRVILQIVPFGDEANAREIGRLDIFNKGIADPTPDGWDRGGYHKYGVIELTPKTGFMNDKEVMHRRFDGAWELVRKAIDELEIEGP